jgi:hypothetical protein
VSGACRLTPLQRRVLEALRGLEPPPVLTGGAALGGFHLGHRVTRDLDLFFRGRHDLDELPALVESRLRAAGLAVRVAQSAPAFRRLDVRVGDEAVEVDLVADPVPAIEPPVAVAGGLLVDSTHEILVNKLNALLGRSAIRDLFDVQRLLEAGADLEAGLRDAARKDAGFSPPMLAWVLESLPVVKLARDAGFEPEPLEAFRIMLRERLLAAP